MMTIRTANINISSRTGSSEESATGRCCLIYKVGRIFYKGVQYERWLGTPIDRKGRVRFVKIEAGGSEANVNNKNLLSHK